MPSFAIPGLQNPVTPINCKERRFAASDGAIDIKVTSVNYLANPSPKIVVRISREFSREKDLVLEDTGERIYHRDSGDYEPNVRDYYFRLDPTDVLLARGSYVVRVELEGKEINVFPLIVSNNPAREDSQDYIFLSR